MRTLHAVLLMAATNIIGCTGARTDVSAIMPPPGAMRICDEGVIDAPGVVSARPNFVTHTVKTGSPEEPEFFRPRAVVVADGFPFFVSYSAAVDAWRAEDTGVTYTGDATPPDITRSRTQFALVRRNVYLTTDAGIGRLNSTDLEIAEAGMPAPGTGSLALGGSASFLAVGEEVAYRWTLTRTDETGLVTTSAPAPYQSIINGSGATSGVVVTIPLPFAASEGDVLRLFRSYVIASTATPADTMYLAAQVTLDASHTLAREVVITDDVLQVDLGEALYTNSTREGIEGANTQPPRALALSAWQESIWAGSTTAEHALVLDIFDTNGFPAIEEERAGVIGAVAYNTIDGSPVIALSSGDDSEIRVGHSVVGASILDGTRVIAINPGVSLTLSTNATATAPSVAMTVRAVHTIDGQQFIAVLGGAQTADSINANSTTLRARYIESAGMLTGRPGYFRVLIERVTPNPNPFTFSTTASGDEHSYAAADGGDRISTQEVRPHRIAWSKPQEPEHFRALDWLELGREDAHVLAFAPLSDALLVFKEDGIWAVFGSFPSFGVERIGDAVVRSGDAVDVIDDLAYAHTNRGILALNGAGIVANLSEGVIRDEIAPYVSAQASYVRAWPSLGLVLVAMGTIDEEAPSVIYVWNILTRAWCRWTITTTHMAFDPESGTMHAPWSVDRWESRSSVAARGYDEAHTISTWALSADGLTITIAITDAGTWVPEAGDAVVAAVEGTPPPPSRITEVVGDGTDYVITLAEATAMPPYFDLSAYEVAVGVLEWQRQGVTPPSVGGFVRELQVHLDQSDAGNDALSMTALRLTAGGTSDLSTTRYTLAATPTREATYSRPVRFGLSRQLGRSTHLYPYVAVAELYRWRVLGIALVGSGVSDKVRRA